MTSTPAAALRRLLDRPEIVVAPGASDSITARLVQEAGFPAVYLTGFGATASRLGTPDIGLLSQTEMTEHARNMTRAVDVPVVADADTGYGGPSNIERTVQEHLQAGVAAIHLEDQVAPKRCGHLAGVRLIDAEENANRLRCAVRARGDHDLVVIGRTDALQVAGIDEALRRAALYAAAGVDLVFVDGVRTADEVRAIAAGVPGPKVVALIDGTDAATLSVSDLQELGFDLALFPLTTLFAATRAAADALSGLSGTGALGSGPARHGYDDYSRIVGLARHQDLDLTYGA